MTDQPVIYDIYCDASVGPELRGCCSGALIERREAPYGNPQRVFITLTQPNGTNNSGEAAAVALGLKSALDLYNYSKSIGYIAHYNVFSDSLITIRGVREWLPKWVKSQDPNGNLLNSSRDIVANQDFFKYIFNTIISNPGMYIKFYHQDGHVTDNFNRMRKNFKKFNGISPEDIGLNPTTLCLCNDFVDVETRRLINQYLNSTEEDRPWYWKKDILDIGLQTLTNPTIIDSSPSAINIYESIVGYKVSQ